MRVSDRGLEKIFWWFFGGVCVVIVATFAFFIFIAVTLFTAVEDIGEQGARGVIERVWCGKSADCSLSVPKDSR